MNIVIAIKLFTCIESIALGVLTLKRDPTSHRSRLFATYLFLVALISFLEFELVSTSVEAAFILLKRFDVFAYLAVGVMFHFALAYTMPCLSTRPLVIGGIYGFSLVTVAAVELFAYPISARMTPWGFVSNYTALGQIVVKASLWLMSLFSIGTLLLFLRSYLMATDRRARKQTAILFWSLTALVVSGIAFELVMPSLGIAVPFALSATTAFFYVNPFLLYALFRYDVLKMTPAGAAREILQMMSDGVILIDEAGIIHYINEPIRAMLNRPEKEIIGTRFSALPLAPSRSTDTPLTIDTLHSVRHLVDAACYVSPRPGRHIPVSLSISPLVQRQETVGFIVAIRDMSIRKQAEDRRNAVERIMRHDVRNDLTSILGFAELMAGAANLTDTQRHSMMVIRKTGQRMVNQIESYLSLQRMENGTFTINPVPVDIAEIVRDVMDNRLGETADKTSRFQFLLNGAPVPRDVAIGFVTEVSLFYGMLNNLVRNALEASPRNRPVTILVEDRDGLRIRVHNYGIVPKAIRPRFFSMFVTSGKETGTGLGTYSARLIAEALGGAISVETDDEEGTTTVTVAFPGTPA